MPSNSFASIIFITVAILALLPGAYAFGAGDIPDYSFLNDKAFRYVSSALQTAPNKLH